MGAFRSRLSLQSENAALRHQLSVYRRAQRRPAIACGDRLFQSLLARLWHGWRGALFIVQPWTVILWQRKRFCDHWRQLSQLHAVGGPLFVTMPSRQRLRPGGPGVVACNSLSVTGDKPGRNGINSFTVNHKYTWCRVFDSDTIKITEFQYVNVFLFQEMRRILNNSG